MEGRGVYRMSRVYRFVSDGARGAVAWLATCARYYAVRTFTTAISRARVSPDFYSGLSSTSVRVQVHIIYSAQNSEQRWQIVIVAYYNSYN